VNGTIGEVAGVEVSGAEQVLYLVVVPAVIVAVVWGLASIGGPQAKRRYRPGRPYEFIPVWYLANHGRDGEQLALPSSVQAEGTTGGASDRW
jgi:hypothetical protein